MVKNKIMIPELKEKNIELEKLKLKVKNLRKEIRDITNENQKNKKSSILQNLTISFD